MSSLAGGVGLAEESPRRVSRGQQPRESYVDAFRWICILAVLVQHSIYPERQSTSTVDVLLSLKEWTSWCVSGFFLTSGWLSNPHQAHWSGLLHRARRLLRPFLGVNLLLGTLLVGFALVGLPLPAGFEPLEPWFHIRQWVFLQGYGPQFYFLPLLLIVGSLVLLVARIGGRPTAVIVAALCCGAAILMGGVPAMAYGGDFRLLPFYGVAFAIGLLLREDFRSRIAWTVVSTGILLGVWLVVRGEGGAVVHSFLAAPLFALHRLLVRGSWTSLTIWSSGALFLWHAPLVMTAISMALAKFGIVDGLGIVSTWVFTVLACQVLHLVLVRTRWAPYLTL